MKTLDTQAKADDTPFFWDPQQDYRDIGVDFPITSLRSFPGSDGHSYYVVGTTPVPGNKGARFCISLRVFLHELKPRLTMDFRVRVGEAFKETPSNPHAVVAVGENHFAGLGAVNSEWTSALNPAGQHRSITGRFVAAEYGSSIGSVINAAIHNQDIQAVYWTLREFFPYGEFISEYKFVQAFARMMMTSAQNLPGRWTSLSFGQAANPLVSSVDGDMKVMRKVSTAPGTALPVPTGTSVAPPSAPAPVPATTPAPEPVEPDLGPAPKVKPLKSAKGKSAPATSATKAPTAADIGL